MGSGSPQSTAYAGRGSVGSGAAAAVTAATGAAGAASIGAHAAHAGPVALADDVAAAAVAGVGLQVHAGGATDRQTGVARSEQRPWVQNCPGRQARSQAPQWAGSVCRFTHRPPQRGLTVAAAAGAGHAGLVVRRSGARRRRSCRRRRPDSRRPGCRRRSPAGGQRIVAAGVRAAGVHRAGRLGLGAARRGRIDRPGGVDGWCRASAVGVAGGGVAGGVVASGRTGGGLVPPSLRSVWTGL